MHLSYLLERNVTQDVRVHNLTIDSRTVRQGDVFLAITSDVTKRNQYIQQACNQGAVAVVLDQPVTAKNVSLVGDANQQQTVLDRCHYYPQLAQKLSYLAQRLYGKPAIDLIGITGTNGKTSVAWMGSCLLNVLGKPCGYIGTLGAYFENNHYATSLTTPDCITLHRVLAAMMKDGAQCCCIEVSSHALVQKRVAGLMFDVGVFTNLTLDHLDYHEHFHAYKKAKWLLWEQCHSIIANVDDENWQDIPQQKITAIYGIADKASRTIFTQKAQKKTVYIGDIQSTSMHGTGWRMCVDGDTYIGQSPVLGSFMFSNILAIVAIAKTLGFAMNAIVDKVASIQSPPGRMQLLVQKPLIIVDYAHTPDALHNVLQSIQEIANHTSRVAVVFGCGGNRDIKKRPRMGKIAATYADKIFLTTDNPRSEDPIKIIEQIAQGIDDFGSERVDIITDRKAAIYAALRWAREDDIVVVAGKGHESTQQFADTVCVFDDTVVIGSLLEKLHITAIDKRLTSMQASIGVSIDGMRNTEKKT